MTLLGFPKSTHGSTPNPMLIPQGLKSMLVSTRFPARTLAVVVAALITAVALIAIAPSRANAVEATSDSVVEIPLGATGKGLRVKGVKLTALSPAKISKGKLRLKVSDVAVESATKATVVLRGGLKLSKGKRSIKAQGLLIEASGKKLKITGKVGSKRITVLTGTSSLQLVTAATQQVVAPAVTVKLSPGAGKAIRSALKLNKSPNGSLGTFVAVAKADLPKPGGNTGVTLQDLAGARLARPVTAVDVTGQPLKWWLRDSWIRYVTFNLPQDGATGDSPIKDTSHVCQDTATTGTSKVYAINLPFQSGWWDAASSTGALYYGGAVRWYFPDRGIDITASGAEIEINGTSSRAIFRFDDAAEKTAKRGAFLGLNIAAPLSGPALAPNAGTTRIKSTIFTDPATNPFGSFVGQYTGNPGWGCFDIGFSA